MFEVEDIIRCSTKILGNMYIFIKWLATAVLIVGSFVNSWGFYPQGPMILIAGGMLWLWVSIKMRDLPLIVTNSVMVLAGSVPLIVRYFF